MPFQFKKHLNYEDHILLFLMDMEAGSKIEVCKLTNMPEKFIMTIKNLIDEGWVRNAVTK